MTRTFLSLFGLTLAMLMTAPAHADCAIPTDCICFGSGVVVAHITELTPADGEAVTAKLEIEAVAATDTVNEVGDALTIEGLAATQVGDRFIVSTEFATEPHLVRQLTNNGPISCLGTTFTIQQMLDLSNQDDCQEAAEAEAGNPAFECNDHVTPFNCAVAVPKTSPSTALGWCALALAFIGWRRRRVSKSGCRKTLVINIK